MARPEGASYDRHVKGPAAWATALPPQMQDLAIALAAYNVGQLIPEVSQRYGPVPMIRP